MASEPNSIPKMIVPYEWNFECVEEEPITISSKMILFRGKKVFRVGLKNHTLNPVLFLVAIDLNKMGMKVEDVKCGIQGSGIAPATMGEMIKDNIGDEGNLQLFKISLNKKILGNCTFSFRICIEGTDSGYSYKLSDRLAKDQLWAALKNQYNLADVELIVKDKAFPAHKAILAARSQVFADELKKKQVVKGGLLQIRIKTGVEQSTLVKFLHFIYTGEPIGTLADEKLLQLADQYQLTTLVYLCQHALKKIEALQMANLRERLNDNVEIMSFSKITPEEETKIFFDRTTPTFRCTSLLKKSENGQSKCVMQYQNESIFIAYYTEEKEINSQLINQGYITKSVLIHFTCAKHRNFGLQVEDVYCGMPKSDKLGYSKWMKMESKNFHKNAELLHFAVKVVLNFTTKPQENFQFLVNFDIKTISTTGNYYYEMMDDKWPTDLWAAATKKTFTDVEILVGTLKLMEAHRIILCARSPVLNESLNNNSNTEKAIVTFESEFDVEIVKLFLKFLYTGSLKATDGGHQLSRLASMYQVETLKNVCQLLNRVPDVEELTNCLI